MKTNHLYIKNIFWLLLILANTAFAQIKQKDNYVVYINYPDYTIKTTVSNSTKKINVKESLTYYWYSSNKIIQTKGDYDGKLVDGPYTSFYLSSSLKEKGNFKKGLKDGKWISWYENGKINEIINWSKGRKCGEYKKFDSNELLSITAYYKNDKLNGIQTIYNNGEIDKKIKYKYGKEIVKRQKIDSTSQLNTIQQKRSWKEKITTPFTKKKKKEAATTNEPIPGIPKKTWKEKLNSFFGKREKIPASATAEAPSEELKSTVAPEIEQPKKRKTKKTDKTKEAGK
jgi:hypothetical protein